MCINTYPQNKVTKFRSHLLIHHEWTNPAPEYAPRLVDHFTINLYIYFHQNIHLQDRIQTTPRLEELMWLPGVNFNFKT